MAEVGNDMRTPTASVQPIARTTLPGEMVARLTGAAPEAMFPVMGALEVPAGEDDRSGRST